MLWFWCFSFRSYKEFFAYFFFHEPKKNINEDKIVIEEDFVETTINNFQALVDLGIIDIITLQEERGISYVLKRKK